MTTIAAALNYLLTTDTTVGALVGDRVYNGQPNDNEPQPYLTFEESGGSLGLLMTGPGGMNTASVQINCFGETAKSVSDVGRAAQKRLHGFRGSVLGLDIALIECENLINLDEQKDKTTLPGRGFNATVSYTTPPDSNQQ